jgi:hypothetical protein
MMEEKQDMAKVYREFFHGKPMRCDNCNRLVDVPVITCESVDTSDTCFDKASLWAATAVCCSQRCLAECQFKAEMMVGQEIHLTEVMH